VLRLSNYKNLAEVVVSAIQVNEGTDIADVTKRWSGSTSIVVDRAINKLVKGSDSGSGVVRF
ncbi:hypothetical protein DCD95_19995, partial [Acinetobacter baumannii]|uniref:hypothetical protein n=1 Tax=Acinetobacter baumannii TaxID=470 RepID=UPI000D50F896